MPEEHRDWDEFDRLRRRVLWSLTTGLYILGSRDGDRRNGMTVSQVMQVASEPNKIVAASVHEGAYTHELISAGGVFSVNILKRDNVAVVRKFVKPVEVDLAKKTLNGFAFHDGKSGAPILDIAAAFLDCRVVQAIETGDHVVFLGEVVDAAFTGDENTPILRMEDTRMKYGG